MTKHREVTQQGFDQLLAWLDQDRGQAGRKYESIRHSLIKIFVWGGCHDAEDLADEVIDRVTRNVPEIAGDYRGDPAVYFYAVAKRVLMEWRRRRPIEKQQQQQPEPAAPEESADEADERERVYECLRECLQQLHDDERRLLLQYYEEERQAKIDRRKQLAADLGLGLNALRVRVFRIRAVLHACVERCLGPR
jgi:RNA polymerase sigma factor (sigma-70 family)